MSELLKITHCPNCGSEKIKKSAGGGAGHSRGATYVVPGLQFYGCTVCGEILFDRQAVDKIKAQSPALAKRRTQKAA